MKKYLFRLAKRLSWYFVVSAATGVLLVSCKRITSADVSGVYIRSSNGVVDTLILVTNGTFQQTITFDGASWKGSGSWKFSGEIVEFDKFYSAFEIGPDPNKINAVVVIPPKLGTMEFLWVEEGKLLKNSIQPIWFKQPKK